MSWCLTGDNTYTFLSGSTLTWQSETGRIFSHLATGIVKFRLEERRSDGWPSGTFSHLHTESLQFQSDHLIHDHISEAPSKATLLFTAFTVLNDHTSTDFRTNSWEVRDFHFLELRLAQSCPLNPRAEEFWFSNRFRFSAMAAGNLQPCLL